jgi:putative transposase
LYYEALGHDATARQSAYRELFVNAPDEEFVTALRRATNGGWAVGGDRFRAQVEAAAQRRAAPLPRGRKLEMGSG